MTHEMAPVKNFLRGVAEGNRPPPVDWWRTPLGRAVATVAGHSDERVTKHPDGGVTAVSVAQRLRDRA